MNGTVKHFWSIPISSMAPQDRKNLWKTVVYALTVSAMSVALGGFLGYLAS